MPTTERALKQYLFRAFLCFCAGALLSTVLLLFFPMKTRLDTILCLLFGSTFPGGLYVAARFLSLPENKRTHHGSLHGLFDVQTYCMLVLGSPFFFVWAMVKGLLRLYKLNRAEVPHA